MLGRNKGKDVPKELPPAEKQDLVARKFEEVLAIVKEMNRLLTEALIAEFKSCDVLTAKQALIAKMEGILKETGKEMSRISGDSIPKSEPQPPAAPKAAAPAAGAIQPASLGRKLIEQGIITQSQLAEAEAAQKERGGYLGQILVEMGFAKQDVIVQFLVRQCKIPHLSLLDYEISKDVLELVPKEICLRRNLLPIDKLGRILTIAMCDPLDTEALEEIRKLHPELRLKSILCNWQHFKTVSARLFEAKDEKSEPSESLAPAPDSAASNPSAPDSAIEALLASCEVDGDTSAPDLETAPKELSDGVARDNIDSKRSQPPIPATEEELVKESREKSSSKSEPPPPPQTAAPAPKAAASVSGAIRPTGLGAILIKHGMLTKEQLAEAEAAQKERGGFLGQILVEMGFIKQDVAVQFLIKEYKVPYLSLLDYEISKDLLEFVPKEICLRRNLLPVEKLGRILTIAMCDPLDAEALEEIRKLHPDLRVKPVLCNWQHFKTVSARLFWAEDEKSED